MRKVAMVLIATVLVVLLVLATLTPFAASASNSDPELTGKGVTVAVIDTGLNEGYVGAPKNTVEGRYYYFEEKEDGRYAITRNGVTKLYGYYSNEHTQDEDGHGTMVASIISDISPNVTIMPLRCFTQTKGHVAGQYPNAISCIYYAIDHGADIINMSWGMTAGPSEKTREAIQAAADAGCILIAAAGNDGESKPVYPAAYPGVIGVGATDKDGKMTEFSNRGEWVDIYAQGIDIHFAGEPNNFEGWAGTSYSAPVISGVAALALEANPEMTTVELLDLLHKSCDLVEGQSGGHLDVNKLLLAVNAKVKKVMIYREGAVNKPQKAKAIETESTALEICAV